MQRCAVALTGRVQESMVVAWNENGMGAAWHVCIKYGRTVNQLGKTQFKPLAERHGRGTAWYVRISLKDVLAL
jgi:hypothetical protein